MPMQLVVSLWAGSAVAGGGACSQPGWRAYLRCDLEIDRSMLSRSRPGLLAGIEPKVSRAFKALQISGRVQVPMLRRLLKCVIYFDETCESHLKRRG